MLAKLINAVQSRDTLLAAVLLSFSIAQANAQNLVIDGNAEKLSVETDAMCSVSTDSVVSCYVSSRSEQLAVPANIGLVKEVAVGKGHVCVINIDNNVECWGDNSFDRLNVPASASPATHIDTGESHSCALNFEGEALCWGDNSNGRSTPPDNGAAYLDISVGARHSCAVRTDGVVDCWGAEDSGVNVRPDNFPLATKVSVDFAGSCILSVDGDIVCWNRAINSANSIANVPSNGPYTDVTLAGGGGPGFNKVCGLTAEGNADCVVAPGFNLSQETAEQLEQNAVELGPFSAIDTAALYSTISGDDRPLFAGCGIQLDGAIACWQAPDRINPTTSGTPNSPLFVPELSAQIYSASTIELFWDVPNEFNSRGTVVIYEIFRDGEFLVATSNNGSYLDNSLAAGTTYSYQIRATTDSGASADLSDAISVNTSDLTVSNPDNGAVGYELPDRPLAAQNLQALVYGASTLELIWDNPESSNVSYEIYMNGNFVTHTTGSSYFFDNLPTDAEYQFQVVTVDNDGQIEGFSNISVALGEGGQCF